MLRQYLLLWNRRPPSTLHRSKQRTTSSALVPPLGEAVDDGGCESRLQFHTACAEMLSFSWCRLTHTFTVGRGCSVVMKSEWRSCGVFVGIERTCRGGTRDCTPRTTSWRDADDVARTQSRQTSIHAGLMENPSGSCRGFVSYAIVQGTGGGERGCPNPDTVAIPWPRTYLGCITPGYQ